MQQLALDGGCPTTIPFLWLLKTTWLGCHITSTLNPLSVLSLVAGRRCVSAGWRIETLAVVLSLPYHCVCPACFPSGRRSEGEDSGWCCYVIYVQVFVISDRMCTQFWMPKHLIIVLLYIDVEWYAFRWNWPWWHFQHFSYPGFHWCQCCL